MESILVLYPLAGHLGTCHAVWVAVKCSRLALAALLWSAPAHAQQVPDTLEQRLVACAACHGKNGEGLKTNEYYPRIAGKPARYLFNQLVNFRERRRQSPAMNYMVGFLSDDYLRDIARYYAMQPPRYPAPQEKPSSEVQARASPGWSRRFRAWSAWRCTTSARRWAHGATACGAHRR